MIIDTQSDSKSNLDSLFDSESDNLETNTGDKKDNRKSVNPRFIDVYTLYQSIVKYTEQGPRKIDFIHVILFVLLSGGDYTSNPPGIGPKKMMDVLQYYKETKWKYANIVEKKKNIIESNKKKQFRSYDDDNLLSVCIDYLDLNMNNIGELACYIYLANVTKKDAYIKPISLDMMYKKSDSNFEDVYNYIRSKKSGNGKMLEYQHMINNIKRAVWVINYYTGHDDVTFSCCNYGQSLGSSSSSTDLLESRWGWMIVPNDIPTEGVNITYSTILDWLIPKVSGITQLSSKLAGPESNNNKTEIKAQILTHYKNTISDLLNSNTEYSNSLKLLENWKVVVLN
jgi:hypothetical protein